MNYLAKIKENWLSIMLVTLVMVGLSVIITLFQPFEYRSSFSLLVIEKQQNLDAYAAAKSAERLSLSLGQIIYTTSFYDKVLTSGYLSSDFNFPEDEQERRQQWRRQIETRVLADVGMVKVSVYNQEPERATELAKALAIVLSENGTEYVGGGNSIVLKVVDYPFTDKDPARPNIPMNLIAGLLIGFGGSSAYHIYRGLSDQKKRKNKINSDKTPDDDQESNAVKSFRQKENEYIIENYVSNKPEMDQVDDIPGRKNVSENVRIVNDREKEVEAIQRGRSVWNEPEEEFNNFE